MGRPASPVTARFTHVGRQRNCVYLLELSNGLVKVGFSNNPRTRLGKLALIWNRKGVQIERYEVFVGQQRGRWFDPQKRELKSIKALHQIAPAIPGHREYFDAISFDSALATVRSILEA